MQTRRLIRTLLGVFMACSLFCIYGYARADTLSLQESIKRGVLLHPAVLSAKGELKTAKGLVWQSLSPSSPIVRVENEWIPEGSDLSDFGEQTLGISQTLDFPLVTYFQVKSAVYNKQSAYSAYQVAAAQASAEITMAYLDVWVTQCKVLIAESLHQAIESLARGAELKYEVGEGTSIERDRLKAQAEKSNQSLQQANLQLTIAMVQLGQLIGQNLVTSFYVSEPGPIDTTTLNSSHKAASASIISEAESALKAAQAKQNAARLSWLPQLELELFRQRNNQGGRLWGGAISVSVPLWFTLSGTGNLKNAAGSVEKAKADLEQVRRKWNLDWVEAIQSFKLAKSRMESLERVSLPASRGAYKASLIAYEIGELGVTDLIASFLEKQAAELDYLDAQRELWQWRTKLDILRATQR